MGSVLKEGRAGLVLNPGDFMQAKLFWESLGFSRLKGELAAVFVGFFFFFCIFL